MRLPSGHGMLATEATTKSVVFVNLPLKDVRLGSSFLEMSLPSSLVPVGMPFIFNALRLGWVQISKHVQSVVPTGNMATRVTDREAEIPMQPGRMEIEERMFLVDSFHHRGMPFLLPASFESDVVDEYSRNKTDAMEAQTINELAFIYIDVVARKITSAFLMFRQ